MRLMESMTRLTTSLYTVRVWRNETPDAPETIDNRDIKATVNAQHETTDPVGLARAIEECGRVEAVEVLDAEGNGIVLYPDWT